MQALKRAIAAAGGLTKLAGRLKVSPQTVSNWKRRNSVPPGRVLAIESAVRKRVRRHDLRPDLYPRP
jgi:DNA-binding transcriptional regulator YdaS (Cro superfamily)